MQEELGVRLDDETDSLFEDIRARKVISAGERRAGYIEQTSTIHPPSIRKEHDIRITTVLVTGMGMPEGRALDAGAFVDGTASRFEEFRICQQAQEKE